MLAENSWIDFFFTWWSGEILKCHHCHASNFSCPRLSKMKQALRAQHFKNIRAYDTLPFFALLLSMLCTHWFYGPGALLYPLAALIWAASTYRLFSLAIINSLVALTLYHSVTTIFLDDPNLSYLTTVISIRVGLIILGLATIILCVSSQNRKQLFQEVLYLANHDSLTETLNRRSFLDFGEKALQHPANTSLSLLMLDIDHFKRMNDQYGHYVGDRALQHLVSVVKSNLREDDLFSRIGGEEFIILIQNKSLAETEKLQNAFVPILH